MRVLLITETMFPLGPANQLSILARRLADKDHEVHVAILKDRPESQFPVPKLCHIHHLQIGTRDFLGWRKLRKLARAIQPNVCHDWSAFGITRAAIGDLFPHVTSPQCAEEFVCDSSSCALKILWDHWRSNSGKNVLTSTHESFIEEWDDLFNETHVVSPAIADHQPNKKQAQAEVREELKLPNDAILIGAYAPFIPKMRLKDLIWAADLITCIRDDIHLVLMGSGIQEGRLKRFLRTTEATGHVHFVGLPENALKIVSACDIFWHSHLRWGLPSSILTSMRFGVPTISVLGKETETAIIHQTTGFGVGLGARDEFARWSKYLIEQAESAAKISRQAKDHVLQNFSADAFVDRFVKIYESLNG